MKSNGNGFEEMVAIQLAVRSWPGQAKLSAEDLGLKEGEVPEIFYLGNKKLYPQEWRQLFNHLSGKARTYLNDHSFPFVVEYVRAIPKRNLARVVERLEELKAEYLAKAEEFVDHYDALREQWREKYADIWPRLAPHYPGKDRLRRKFDFYWSVFELKGAEVKEGSAPEIIEAYEQARADLQERYHPDVNFQTRYACYTGNRLWCCGDGEGAQRLGDDGKYQAVPCPCLRLEANYAGKDKCKPNGTLQVLLQGVDRIGGVWKFRTTSWNSVHSIMSSLKLIQAITGGVLAGIPLKLVLSPKTVTIPGTGQNMIVYVVSLEFPGTEQELAKIGYDIAKRRADHRAKMDLIEAEARKALEHLEETPEEMREVQEEFYPEGVTIEVQPEAVPESEAQPEDGPPEESTAENGPPVAVEKPEAPEEISSSPELVPGEEPVPLSWDSPPPPPQPGPNSKTNKGRKVSPPPPPPPPGEMVEGGKPTLF
ncbi:MAG: DUF3150 domain-containing protein [Syntrophales bacterium]|nr:DUF3150 domain-containing protein [Syntrophales bacterium]